MANFSNYAESGILNLLFRSNTNAFAAPGNLSIALCYAIPSESQNGTNIPELPNTGNYARYNLGAPSNSNFTEVSQDANGSGTITNSADLVFNTASADWGHISGVAIVTSNTYGAGQMLAYAAVSPVKFIQTGDAYRYSASNLTFYLG